MLRQFSSLFAIWCSFVLVGCEYYVSSVPGHNQVVYTESHTSGDSGWVSGYPTGSIRTSVMPQHFRTVTHTSGGSGWGGGYPTGSIRTSVMPQNFRTETYTSGGSGWGGSYPTGSIRTSVMPQHFRTGNPSWGGGYSSGFIGSSGIPQPIQTGWDPAKYFKTDVPRPFYTGTFDGPMISMGNPPHGGWRLTGTESGPSDSSSPVQSGDQTKKANHSSESRQKTCHPVGDHVECQILEKEEKLNATQIGDQKGTVNHTKEERKLHETIE